MAFKLVKKPKITDPGNHSARYLLHKHLVGDRPARPYDKIHASDLMSTRRGQFCAREHSLGMLHHNPRNDERIPTCQAVTFAYGYKVEDLVRAWFAEMDRAHGRWQCTICEKKTKFGLRPPKCPKCGAPGAALEYFETTFRLPISGVGCRPDLFIDIGQPKLKLVEIKSIDKEEIKKLHAPLAEHRFRTSLYLRAVQESGSKLAERINLQEAIVLYVTKGGYGWQDKELFRWKLRDDSWSPFRDFDVQRDDSLTDTLLAQAAQHETFKKTGELPERICPTQFVTRAKYCKQGRHCWATKK